MPSPNIIKFEQAPRPVINQKLIEHLNWFKDTRRKSSRIQKFCRSLNLHLQFNDLIQVRWGGYFRNYKKLFGGQVVSLILVRFEDFYLIG